MEKSGEMPSSMFNDGILALELLLHRECTQVSHSVAQKAYETIKAAPIEQKRNVFWDHFFHSWTGELSDFIEKAFQKYVQLGVANRGLIGEEPLQWAETNLRQLLEPRLGHEMKVAHPDLNGTSEMSYAERVTGGQKAHNWVTYWIAEACAGEGQNLGDWMGEGEWELDDEAVDSWQAPAWLSPRFLQEHPVEDRLDVKTTALEVGLIHFELWRKLKDAIERARLRAKVDIAASIHPAMTKRVRKKSLTEAEKVISEAIKDDRKGVRYCVYLDMNNIKPPKAWELCPQSYVKAYKSPLWRKRIQDQKSRVKRKMKT